MKIETSRGGDTPGPGGERLVSIACQWCSTTHARGETHEYTRHLLRVDQANTLTPVAVLMARILAAATVRPAAP